MYILPLQPNQLTKEVLSIMGELSPTDETDLDVAKEILRIRQQNGHFTWAVYIDGRIVGVGSLFLMKKIPYGGKPIGLIEDVVITKEFCGLGYGKRLVEHITEIAQLMGCYKCILNCREELIPFYEDCGYTRSVVQMRKDL